MKRLSIILILSLTLMGCNNESLLKKVENPQEETTIKLQEQAKKDTTFYTLAENKNKDLLILQNAEVKYKVKQNTDDFITFGWFLGVITVFFIVGIIGLMGGFD